jgi:MFS family permease
MLCGLSQNLTQFVGARVLQGVFGTMMLPVGRLLLMRTSDRSDMARLINLSMMPQMIAPLVGPALGGYLTTYWSWAWVFYLNVPVGLLGVFFVLRFLPNPRAEVSRPFDLYGIVINGLAMTSLLYGLDRISQPGEDWRPPAGLLVVGLGFGFMAVRHALSHPHPAVSLSTLKYKTFVISGFTGGTMVRMPIRAVPFILPIMFQVGFGMTAFLSGLTLLVMTAADMALKPMLVRTLRRYGFRKVLEVSAMTLAISVALCALMTATTPLWAIFILVGLVGLTRSYAMSGTVTLMADVPVEELGPSTTLTNVMIQITGALAITFSAIIMNASAAIRGAKAVGAFDCRVALLIVAAFALLSVLSFRKLAADAGADMAGGGPGQPTLEPVAD